MPRIGRIVLEGLPYHITQRGNGRQQVFFEDRDYALYLDLLRHYSAAKALQILGYCLMPNHVHLVAVPERRDSMARAMGRIHADYARHFNLSRRSCGHVWQARYFSCPLDSEHLWHALAYVERNPFRASMVDSVEQYRWTSAAAHIGSLQPPDFLAMQLWRAYYTPKQWRDVLNSSVHEEAFGRRLHESSLRGRPLGSEEFVQRLEDSTGRLLKLQAPGRRPH